MSYNILETVHNRCILSIARSFLLIYLGDNLELSLKYYITTFSIFHRNYYFFYNFLLIIFILIINLHFSNFKSIFIQ